jgi:hypothetical protein
MKNPILSDTKKTRRELEASYESTGKARHRGHNLSVFSALLVRFRLFSEYLYVGGFQGEQTLHNIVWEDPSPLSKPDS